jgi:hypothetical protein
VVVDQYGSRSDRVVVKGRSSTFSFTADRVGQFAYYCSAPGMGLVLQGTAPATFNQRSLNS